jgi:hypothetical protein
MQRRLYQYIGPEEIRVRSQHKAGGRKISTQSDLKQWTNEQANQSAANGLIAATFVVNSAGILLLADRHSEHVACASGDPVLSAGELFLTDTAPIGVEEISNLSTGYCPEPCSWSAVANALDLAEIPHPGRFSPAFQFRRCPKCGQRNLIKDNFD